MEEKIKLYGNRLTEVENLISGYIKTFNDGPCKCGGCSMQSILSSCDVIARMLNVNYEIKLLPRSFIINKIVFTDKDDNSSFEIK